MPLYVSREIAQIIIYYLFDVFVISLDSNFLHLALYTKEVYDIQHGSLSEYRPVRVVRMGLKCHEILQLDTAQHLVS